MTDPFNRPPMTREEERNWRSEFKGLGREVVREQHRGWALRKHDLAVAWLREQDKKDERNRRLSFYIPIAALIIAVVALYRTW
jgi:hypothetical protein